MPVLAKFGIVKAGKETRTKQSPQTLSWTFTFCFRRKSCCFTGLSEEQNQPFSGDLDLGRWPCEEEPPSLSLVCVALARAWLCRESPDSSCQGPGSALPPGQAPPHSREVQAAVLIAHFPSAWYSICQGANRCPERQCPPSWWADRVALPFSSQLHAAVGCSPRDHLVPLPLSGWLQLSAVSQVECFKPVCFSNVSSLHEWH